MGFKFKSITGAISDGFKSVGNGLKSVASGVWDVTKGVVTGEYLAKIGGTVVKAIGSAVVDDALGLDKLGNEWAQVGSDLYQVGKVLGGDYHDDLKKIQEQQTRLQAQIDSYNNNVNVLSDKLDSLIAFHEIFQMSAANNLDNYIGMYGPTIDAAITEISRLTSELKSEYDFVLSLTQGAFLQRVVGSLIMMIGGLISDLSDIVEGRADSATWKRAVTSIVLIVVVVAMWWNPIGWLAITAAVASTIAALMAMDGMYSNGAATGTIMSMLDFLFNDALNLDDRIGKDFDKFDKDHEDYQEMVMYTQVALALASAGAGWASSTGNYATAYQYGTQPWSQQTAMLAGQDSGMAAANSITTMFGIDTSTYESIYSAYSKASSVNDVVNTKKAYDAISEKFREDSLKVESAINSKYSKNFMKHYKDTAYFLQDQQEHIDRYVWSMTADNMYVDPYGTTPVANIRFTPDKDTRGMSFGFEDMFDDSRLAGSRSYFNNIIYGG